jgi:hypothetical protein
MANSSTLLVLDQYECHKYKLTMTLRQEILDTSYWSAPQVEQRSGSHRALLAYHDITAGDLGYIVLVRPASRAEVRVTLPHGQEAWTLLRGTLRLTPDKTDNFCNQ